MNSKLTSIVLGILLIGSLAYAFYANSQITELKKEIETSNKEVQNWEKKYEEALIDMEEAFKRLEEKDNELKAALEEANKQKAKK